MEFFSFAFISFTIVGVILHELAGKLKGNCQWIVRLIASMLFYFYLAHERIVFLVISAITVWLGGIVIDRIISNSKRRRKVEGISREEKKKIKAEERKKKNLVVILVLLVNLGILGYIKYYLPMANKSIAVPLGISYYTFMAISYLIDVYGEKYAVEKNLAKFLLFISWFPQIIEGPFNRYDAIKNSLFGKYSISWETWKRAMLLFAFGAIKKYAVADVLAPVVNSILLGDVVNMPGSFILLGAFLRAIQQYGDFSGGIDMVVSTSMLFGVTMAENFRQPYFSPTLAEFWRRWHMSLGSFMRDYVFYPFAMNDYVQKLTAKISKKYGSHWGRSFTGGVANVFVFVLVGVWHGSELHYVLWGLYHGIIIAISDALAPTFAKVKILLHIGENNRGFKAFQIIRTFVIIMFASYFDAIENVRNGFVCFKNTFTSFGLDRVGTYVQQLFVDELLSMKSIVIALVGSALIFVVSYMKEYSNGPISWLYSRPIVIRWGIYYFLVLLVLVSFTVASSTGGFMYAAF